MRRLCVFCGSSLGTRVEYQQTAAQLGRRLAKKGIGLVYGGAAVGLMGVLADAALNAGGEVIGVIPRALEEKEIAHREVTQLEIVDSMHERKARMASLSDGFVALPGGMGTLEELFEILTWAQLGMHQKPCGILNVQNFFGNLLQFLGHVVSEQLMRPEHRALLLVALEVEELIESMRNFVVPAFPKWIDRERT